jgi:prepilin-type N-terminal cleavage/methylation domain-containing protein
LISIIRRHLRRDDGFTLIEVIVALGISAVIFSAMLAAGIAGVRASVVARQNQQSVDVLNRLVEETRAVSYANVAMVPSDLSVGDSAIVTGSTPKYSVPGIGTEVVWVDATGSINPHVATTTTANGVQYTTKTYVTVPDGYVLDTAGQPNAKRLTIVVEWDSFGNTRSRTISTLMTETARGLPLPEYSASPTSSTVATVNPSTTLTWGFQVRNRGARDAFNLSADTGTWAYYEDADCDGSRDIGEDTALANTDAGLGDTRPDTGKLEPNNYPPYCVIAQRTIGATETGTSSVTFTLQSSAQADAEGASVSVGPFTVTVTTGSTGGSASPTPSGTATSTAPTTVCEPAPAGAGTPFGFRNGTAGASGDTSSQYQSAMTENFCMNQPTAANYSTDVGAGTGRSITTGGTVSSTTASNLAEWLWNPASNKTVASGTATASVLVSCPSAGANLTLNGAIGLFNEKSGTFTSKGTGSTTVSCATANAWGRVTVPMTVSSSFGVANKYQGKAQYLSVRLWVTGGSAGQKLRVNYEQADAKSFLYVSIA